MHSSVIFSEELNLCGVFKNLKLLTVVNEYFLEHSLSLKRPLKWYTFRRLTIHLYRTYFSQTSET